MAVVDDRELGCMWLVIGLDPTLSLFAIGVTPPSEGEGAPEACHDVPPPPPVLTLIESEFDDVCALAK
jgi:hypothetical protein